MNRRIARGGVLTLLVILSMFAGAAPVSLADGNVEQRIADFWARVDSLKPTDFLSAADLGQWGLNVIERNPRARTTVTDFRASTGAMQAGMDRAGLAPADTTPVTAPTTNVEQRIADFWKRVDSLQPGDFLSAADLGGWALNVIERNPRARTTVTDFRGATGAMQAGMDRAGLAPVSSTPIPSGMISTYAGTGTRGFSGDGGPATAAQFFYADGIALDAAGNLYIADRWNFRVRKVTPGGIISTYAGNGTVGLTGDGTGDGGPATAAQMSPGALAFDAAGNLYIADRGGNQRIRKVTPGGIISTYVGGGATVDGSTATTVLVSGIACLAFDAAGNLYFCDANFGSSRILKVSPGGIVSTYAGLPHFTDLGGFSGDGGPATAAQLDHPAGLAFDAAGNLYIADGNGPGAVGRVRKVTPGGIISTYAGGGSAVPGDGGPATAMQLSAAGVTLDAAGNLYIAGRSRVWRVTPGGIISTYAGGGSAVPGDGGPATAAQLSGYAVSVAFDAAGNLYIADNYRVRRVRPY